MSGPLERARAIAAGTYPGCARRLVKDVRTIDGGAFVKLECGHEQWIGGLKDGCYLEVERPCLEFPCYKSVRPMGDLC